MNKSLIRPTLTAAILLGATTAVFLYASGYRISREENSPIDLVQTGMIGARSIPESANVYVNNVLTTATNDTVPSLDPGTYTLKIIKNGFVPWEKEVEVFAELVTDITAVLISQSPRLEPLTNTGARVPVISPSLSKLAYFSKDGQESGIWIIPLTSSGLSLFRSDPFVAIEDTFSTIFSTGKSIEWSPDEQELLVQNADEVYYLIDIETEAAQSTASPETIRQRWDIELLKKRSDFIQRLDLPEEMAEIATSKESAWAPDEKKFLYAVQTGDTIDYRVYNMEKPIPVGETVDNLVFTTNVNDIQPFITWYADSFHLILVDGPIEEENKGTISLIRIDGTNKTEIYSNTIFSPNVYSSPGGEKLIFLTSLRSSEQTDLYTVGIR